MNLKFFNKLNVAIFQHISNNISRFLKFETSIVFTGCVNNMNFTLISMFTLSEVC